MRSDQIPADWYVDALEAASANMAWTDRTASEVDRVVNILQPHGGERVLILYARERLPQRSWIPSSSMNELVEHRWNKREKRLEGLMVPARFGEIFTNMGGIELTQRLYGVEELREIYDSIGMEQTAVYHGNGRPSDPSPKQFEIFVEARLGQ
jgi:hypothetical protein